MGNKSKSVSMLTQLSNEVKVGDLTYEEMQVLILTVVEEAAKEAEEIEVKASRLSEAENLLSNAHDLLDDVHCYETEVYREIGEFLYEEEGEE